MRFSGGSGWSARSSECMDAEMKPVVVFLIAAACASVVVSAPPKGKPCLPVDGQPSCVCKVPKQSHHPGGMINLTSIALSTGYAKYVLLVF